MNPTMLNTQKLLYILPDVALIVELLPGKKPHSFVVQSFRQINGQYVGEDELVGPNIVKLFSKLEEETYHLILPDELFTNAIVTIQETSDTAIAQYLKDKLLPNLELSIKTHQIDTTVLTTFKGQSKVQLSALEQSILAPIRAGSSFSKVNISAISPLSWTVKSLISLEPSISVLQLGEQLYVALHYIGVDQSLQAPIGEVEVIAETIRTLKGGEPNIQTIYLFSNSLVEEKLKELLSDALPIQQLASLRDDSDQLPSYVKEIVETGLKTLSITDYPIPKFELGQATPTELAEYTNPEVLAQTKIQDDEDGDEEQEALSEPVKPDLLSPATTAVLPATFGEDTSTEIATDASPESTFPLDSGSTNMISSSPKKIDLSKEEESSTIPSQSTREETAMPPETNPAVPEDQPQTATPPTNTSNEGVDLTQFVPATAPAPATSESATPQAAVATPASVVPPTTPAKPKPIKNQTGVSSMMKMIILIIIAFVITVSIGLGAGYFLLNQSGSESTTPTPTPTPESTAVTPTAVPTPTLAPVDPAEVSVLVVNATTKAGYAGQISTKLNEAGFTETSTGNAKGEYATASADLALMKEEDPSLVSALSTATGLSLTLSDQGVTTEDPEGTYDAVIVLTQ